MVDDVRMTPQVAAVLDVFFQSVAQERYGLEVSKLTKLKTGTLYPILARLETAGWLTSHWGEETKPNGPRRRYYRLAGGAGAQAAYDALVEYERPLTQAPSQRRWVPIPAVDPGGPL